MSWPWRSPHVQSRTGALSDVVDDVQIAGRFNCDVTSLDHCRVSR